MWLSKVFCLVLLITITRAQEDSILQTAAKFIGSCGEKNLMLCLKERGLQAVEAALDGNIEITDGVALVKDETAVETVSAVEEALPEEGRAREDALEERIIDRIARFFTSHKLEVKLPKETVQEVNRSMDEARRRKRKGLRKASRILMPILALLQLKTALLLPLLLGAIGGVALMALKALIVGKLALVLSLISVVKKLLHKGKGHETIDVIAHPAPVHHAPIHAHHGGWDAEEHHHHDFGHGPYRRSMTAQDMAYNSYATTNQQ